MKYGIYRPFQVECQNLQEVQKLVSLYEMTDLLYNDTEVVS